MENPAPAGAVRTLSIDIGGTGIKAIVLDAAGQPISSRVRVKTPRPATPRAIIKAIAGLAKGLGEFDRVSVGFPGVVHHGVTESAYNLHPKWGNFRLSDALAERLGKPVRVANDADVQGMGAVAGRGVELLITLGTGLGSALFVDGKLVPNLEMGHHPFRKGKTYEDRLGKAALDRVGKKKWNRTLLRAVDELHKLFNYDRMYIGGGNAQKITAQLPQNVQVVSNVAGLLGGIALWRNSSGPE
jgi:polyphosphate glucokinase